MIAEPRIDPNSDTWRIVRAMADLAIGQAQVQLESHRLPIETTEYLRGRIKAFREVLKLGAPANG